MRTYLVVAAATLAAAGCSTLGSRGAAPGACQQCNQAAAQDPFGYDPQQQVAFAAYQHAGLDAQQTAYFAQQQAAFVAQQQAAYLAQQQEAYMAQQAVYYPQPFAGPDVQLVGYPGYCDQCGPAPYGPVGHGLFGPHKNHPGRLFDGGWYGWHGSPHGTPGYPHHHFAREYVGPPGPPIGQVAYPYYTVRGPRDFLADNPPSIGR